VDSVVVGISVFVITLGGAMGGMWLRGVLPDHHLSAESRDSVKLGIGLVATITALVLGLVTASAKSSFDNLDAAVKRGAAEILSLDRALARYGAETADIRKALKAVVVHRVATVWPKGQSRPASLDPAEASQPVEQLATRIRSLEPKTEEQRAQQSRALALSESLLDERWAVFSGLGPSVPAPFLVILAFWLAVTFTSFGLFAPNNATVIITLAVCALSVAGAMFLILEMGAGFEGLIRVSPKPMLFALEHLDK
jgi:hypothetical protein